MAAFPFVTPDSVRVKTTMCWQGTNKGLDVGGKNNDNNKPKLIPAKGFRFKTHIQDFAAVGISSSEAEILKNKRMPPPREVQVAVNQPDTGGLLENGLVFRQNFTVRSFEIGIDSKTSIWTLMNYLQETALNHQKSLGLLADGFGSSPLMILRNLIWVVCRSRIEVDHYPSWTDVIQVDTWRYRSAKKAVGCNWHVRDFKTGKTVIRATSSYVMMNKKTRKFGKLNEEMLEELGPYFKNCEPILQKDARKMGKLNIDNADHVRTGLMPGWTDMDINQHVSHIKLLNYVLESVPRSIVGNYELSAVSLEYRNECSEDSELQSLSKVTGNNNNQSVDNEVIEFDHLLRLESGREIVRGRTTWKQKGGSNFSGMRLDH